MKASRFNFRYWIEKEKVMREKVTLIGGLNPDNLMQSTGLVDKNGQEIFEGDIVDCEDWWDGSVVVWGNHVWKVENDNQFMVIAPRPYPDVRWYMHCKRLEVIGDKFSNPELLKGTPDE